MKNGSKFLKMAVVGVLGAAAMIGCSSDEGSNHPTDGSYDENGCRSVLNDLTLEYKDVCDGVCVEVTDELTDEVTTKCTEPSSIPEEETTTTVEEATTTTSTSTTTTSSTTSTTMPRPTTTVKKTPAATSPATMAPTTAAPTTQAPTTPAPPTTLPPVNLTYMWSSDNGCGGLGMIILDVDVTGATSAGTVSVSVDGTPVHAYGGASFGIGDTSMIMFDDWPMLNDGSYPVTITASSPTQGPTSRTTRVTYNCSR